MENKIIEIKNPLEFQKKYLTETNALFCPFCFNSSKDEVKSFLQVAPLDSIRNLHKHKSFASVRRRFYTAVLLTSGTTKETIGDKSYTFQANTLYFIPENQLHSIDSWSSDVKGYHCIFDAEYFLLCLKNQVKLSKYPFFQMDKAPFLKLTDIESQLISSLLLKMSTEFLNRKTVNDDLLVRLYLNVFLIEAERIYQNQNTEGDTSLSRREQLVAKFKLLVTNRLREFKQVADYAEALHVNPQYLNDTIKEVTGNSASSFIHQQLLTEAKACLIQTDDTILEIADYLNFADQSYFARFFKKHTGLSPSQFRSQHGH